MLSNQPPDPPAPTPAGASSRWARWGLLVGVPAVVAAVAAAAVLRQPPAASEPPVVPSPVSDFPRVPAYAINEPEVLPVAAARLKEDEPVFGVSVAGKHRAYRVSAFCEYPMVHVVNDRLADCPVSVAHCDRTGCTAVVRGDPGNPRLSLAFGGWYRGQMYVRANGDHFYCLNGLQSVDPQAPGFPFEQVQFERTTWGAWRRAHPDTDVYVAPPRNALRGGGR